MAIVDKNSLSTALKHYYDTRKVQDVISRDHPFLAMLLSRAVPMHGDIHAHYLQYALGDGRSSSFPDARANPNGTKGVQFGLTHVNDYAIVQISGEAIDMTASDVDSFFRVKTNEFDAKLQQLSNSLSHALFRSGSGSIGRVSASQSGAATTITLANADDIIFFQVGMRIVADAADGGGTVGTTVSYIKSVDLSAGTFTVSASDGGAAATATAADLAADQYIFPVGDYGQKLSGVASWLPASVASNDSFFGVNRSVDRTRMAGWYLDDSSSGKSIEDSIYDAVKKVCRFSQAKPDTVFCTHEDWATLNKTLNSKVQYIDVKAGANAGIFFKGIMLNGPKGPLNIIPDADMLPNELLVCDPSTFELMHRGSDVIRLLTYDGNDILRVSDADAIEARWGYRAQLACKAPAFNARVKLR